MLRLMADQIIFRRSLRSYLDRKTSLVRRVRNTTSLRFLLHRGLLAPRSVSGRWLNEPQVARRGSDSLGDLSEVDFSASGSFAGVEIREHSASSKLNGLADNLKGDSTAPTVFKSTIVDTSDQVAVAWGSPEVEGTAEKDNEGEQIVGLTPRNGSTAQGHVRIHQVGRRGLVDESVDPTLAHPQLKAMTGATNVKLPKAPLSPREGRISTGVISPDNAKPVGNFKFHESADLDYTDGSTKAPVPGDEDIQLEKSSAMFEPQNNSERTPSGWARRLANAALSESDTGPGPKNDLVREVPNTDISPVAPSKLLLHETANPPIAYLTSRSERRLTEHARQLLIPLVGLDPSTIRIYQQAHSLYMSPSHQVDAITRGDTVILGPNVGNESAEHLGLIAHELTHVARARQPRFIPPVALPKRREFGGSVSSAGSDDEEGIAQLVENRVRPIARKGGGSLSGQPSAVNAINYETPGTSTNSPDAKWAGLPAPWESLPMWMTTNVAADPVLTSSATKVERVSQGNVVAPNTVQTALVHAAASDRTVKDEVPEGAVRADTNASGHVDGPDPEQLAREVYDVLKRRLATERRRAFR